MSVEVGQVINGKYRILRLIGDGGMGSVYEARHEALGSRVALKFLHAELSRTGVAKRFLQEARASARIESPHVVRVTDVDQTPDSLAFIVLEYLEGRTLQKVYEDLYREGRALAYADALEYAVQICEGVEAAHAAGIIHRDLKPDNVMITTGSKGIPLVKLLDFGIAKVERTGAGLTPTPTGKERKNLTKPGVLLGTPEYMAPEQVYGAENADARSDVFALGVIFFEMFAGRRPVGGDEPHQIAVSHVTGEICKLLDLAPNLPVELAAAIHKAMSPQPKDRFATVRELHDVIEPYANAVRPAGPSRLSTGNVNWQAALGGSQPPGTPAGAGTRHTFQSQLGQQDPFGATSPAPALAGPSMVKNGSGPPPPPAGLSSAPSYPPGYPPVPPPWNGAGPVSAISSSPAPVSALWPVGLPPPQPLVAVPPRGGGWGLGRILLVVGFLAAAAGGVTATLLYFDYYDDPKPAPTVKKPQPKPKPTATGTAHKPGIH